MPAGDLQPIPTGGDFQSPPMGDLEPTPRLPAAAERRLAADLLVGDAFANEAAEMLPEIDQIWLGELGLPRVRRRNDRDLGTLIEQHVLRGAVTAAMLDAAPLEWACWLGVHADATSAEAILP